MVKDASDEHDPLVLLDRVLSDSRVDEPELLNTQLSTPVIDSIRRLEDELAFVKMQRNRYKEDLEMKSREWKAIKDKLRQRQSIRNIFVTALNDSDQEQDNAVATEANVIDLSQVSQKSNLTDGEDLEHTQLPSGKDFNSTKLDKRNLDNHSNDCPCCSKFYKAVCTTESELSERRKSVSRHAYRQNMPGTPPGFWNVGFTQD